MRLLLWGNRGIGSRAGVRAPVHPEQRTAQKNQQRLVTNPVVQASFTEILGLLKPQIADLAETITQHLHADPLWRELDRTFRTIKGVADRTADRIMAELPEVGTLSHKVVARLVGVAPLAQDRGKHQ